MLRVTPYAVARLAQLVERKALNLVVVGSSPTVGVLVSALAGVGPRSVGCMLPPEHIANVA